MIEDNISEQPETIEEPLKPKKIKKVQKEDSELLTNYRALRKAAQNVLDLYAKTHSVSSSEDYRYPGLRGLAEVLKS